MKPKTPMQCPACHSVIYSRKAKACLICGAELPEELRLTGAQKKIMKDGLDREKKRCQAFLGTLDIGGSI